MRESGNMDRHSDKENSIILMEIFMRAIGQTIKLMAMESTQT
jgi:hypothetical protein